MWMKSNQKALPHPDWKKIFTTFLKDHTPVVGDLFRVIFFFVKRRVRNDKITQTYFDFMKVIIFPSKIGQCWNLKGWWIRFAVLWLRIENFGYIACCYYWLLMMIPFFLRFFWVGMISTCMAPASDNLMNCDKVVVKVHDKLYFSGLRCE